MSHHPDRHAALAHATLIDALFGLGLPDHDFADSAVGHGLVTFINDVYSWYRPALEELPLASLQDLYMALKFREVAHEHQ